MTSIVNFCPIADLGVDPETGIGSISLRGLAKLCGVSRQTWKQRGSIFTKKIDETLAADGFDPCSYFTEDGRVCDLIAAQVIKFYAYEGYEKARQIDKTLSAIGLRQAIRDAIGWKPSRKLSPEEIVELCCLPVPTSWQRRFPEEYYDELSRLTGLEPQGHRRPALWGDLTRELVYDCLPSGVYTAVKQCKESTGSFDKLHQFLSDEGVAILEAHQRTLLPIMQCCASLTEVRQKMAQVKTRQYQLLLL